MSIRKFKVGVRLSVLAVFFLMSLLLFGIYTWHSLKASENRSQVALHNAQHYAKINDLTQKIRNDFYQQTLNAPTRQTQASQTASANVQAALAQLKRIYNAEGWNDAIVEDAIQAHYEFNAQATRDPKILVQHFEKLSLNLQAQTQDKLSEAAQNLSSAAMHANIYAGLGLALILILGSLLAHYLISSVTRPLKGAIDIANTVAAGNLNTSIVVSGKDETSHLMNALQEMTISTSRIVSEVRSGSAVIRDASTKMARDLSLATISGKVVPKNWEKRTALSSAVHEHALENYSVMQEAAQLATANLSQVQRNDKALLRSSQSLARQMTSVAELKQQAAALDELCYRANQLTLDAALEATQFGQPSEAFLNSMTQVCEIIQQCANMARQVERRMGFSHTDIEISAHELDVAYAEQSEYLRQAQQLADMLNSNLNSSQQQSQQLNQLHLSLEQMDKLSKEYAKKLELAALAASSVQQQAQRLESTVSQFQLGATSIVRNRPKLRLITSCSA